MGSDKALLRFDGELLVLRVAQLVGQVAAPVMLAPGRRGRLGDLGYVEVDDEQPDAGPLGGLVAGVAASPHELVATVAVDMPFANPALLTQLAGLWRDEDAVVPANAGGLQPLHAVYTRRALPKLRLALKEGIRAMHDALERLVVREVGPDEWRAIDPAGKWDVNVNDQRDLRDSGEILGPE